MPNWCQLHWLALAALLTVACQPDEPRLTDDAPLLDVAARLAELVSEDQQDRVSLSVESMQDTSYLKALITADSARTAELLRMMTSPVWPALSEFADSTLSDFLLIVQHSPSSDLRARALSEFQPLALAGRMGPEFALLFDEVRSDQGQPQRYGTNFRMEGDRLVPQAIESLAALDSLRGTLGLPPMAEYVRVLSEAYDAEVTWPPADGGAGVDAIPGAF